MKYRTLGKSGVVVSVVGLGTWQLGDAEWGAAPERSKIRSIFDTARECGINFIDTAECYGDHTAEERIGECIENDREDWVVATKFGHVYRSTYDRTEDFSAEGMRAQLDASLRALRTDYVDVLQVHNMTTEHIENAELWRALKDEKQRGRIRAIGASVKFDPACLDTPVDVLQIIYNRLDRRAESELLGACRERGIGTFARVPLARGLLTGKYEVGVRFPEGDPRHRYTPESIDTQLEEVAQIKQNELPPGVPMAEWALAWCLRNPAVSAVVPGARSPEQVRLNAKAADLDIEQATNPWASEPG